MSGKTKPSRPVIAPRFKLWFSSEDVQGVFGDGKWRLLKALEQEGSLQAVSKLLGISYRKAWGDLRKSERSLNVKLVQKVRGGPGGGGTRLTPLGRHWVRSYGSFRSEIEKAVNKAYERYMEKLVEKE